MRFFHGHWARTGGSSFPASSNSETSCGFASSTELLSAGAAATRYTEVKLPEETDKWCFSGNFCKGLVFAAQCNFYYFGLMQEFHLCSVALQ